MLFEGQVNLVSSTTPSQYNLLPLKGYFLRRISLLLRYRHRQFWYRKSVKKLIDLMLLGTMITDRDSKKDIRIRQELQLFEILNHWFKMLTLATPNLWSYLQNSKMKCIPTKILMKRKLMRTFLFKTKTFTTQFWPLKITHQSSARTSPKPTTLSYTPLTLLL